MFKPGPLSVADCAELNRLARQVADLSRLSVSAPLFMASAGGGVKVIGLSGDPSAIKKGKLDEELVFGGEAVMSVWRYDAADATEADTLEDVDVHDWLLTTGQSIALGAKVVAYLEGARWYVIAAEC
jgi:hypothetical protein